MSIKQIQFDLLRSDPVDVVAAGAVIALGWIDEVVVLLENEGLDVVGREHVGDRCRSLRFATAGFTGHRKHEFSIALVQQRQDDLADAVCCTLMVRLYYY